MSLERFWLAFIPLFVAFDVVGLLPLFWGLSQGMPREQRQEAIHQSTLVAWVVGPAFLLVSEWIFHLLGLQLADVMIAGGVILFGLALNDLLHPEKRAASSPDDLGVVPLGIPLIVGPAVLTTLLVLRKRYGLWMTLSSFGLNLLLTWVVLMAAEWLVHRLGRVSMRVMSKIASLVLAAFAVMLMRQGVTLIMGGP